VPVFFFNRPFPPDTVLTPMSTADSELPISFSLPFHSHPLPLEGNNSLIGPFDNSPCLHPVSVLSLSGTLNKQVITSPSSQGSDSVNGILLSLFFFVDPVSTFQVLRAYASSDGFFR